MSFSRSFHDPLQHCEDPTPRALRGPGDFRTCGCNYQRAQEKGGPKTRYFEGQRTREHDWSLRNVKDLTGGIQKLRGEDSWRSCEIEAR